MLLNILFWNTGRKQLDAQIVEIARAKNVNVIALAEYGANDTNSLLQALTQSGLNFFAVPNIGCTRIHLITQFSPFQIVHKREADRYSIRELRIPGAPPLLLGMVHLPSKLHAEDIDQLHEAQFFKLDVEYSEVEARHHNTVLFGDFNMNPFDAGMVSAAAMNSLPCLITSRRETRRVNGREHSFFYNPTWNLLGDFSGTPGTYFHTTPGYLSHYWNTLDQVLLRPSIAHWLDTTSLQIMTTAGADTLINNNGRPNISDHLPIFFSLTLQ